MATTAVRATNEETDHEDGHVMASANISYFMTNIIIQADVRAID